MSNKPGLIERYRRAIGNETVAGFLLIAAAFLALALANSPIRDTYFAIADAKVGPSAIGLDLSVSAWAADALLAIFFFTVGLELKQEFTIGSLRDPKQAVVPMVAAVFGMLGPIAVYLTVQFAAVEFAPDQFAMGSTIFDGWAVPVATDIAFALGVLGLVGKGLPAAVRTFLMTLAVVDDLLGIIVIAIFFTSGLNFLWLGASLVVIGVFALCVQKRVTNWWILWPLGILAWYFMFRSGIHATISGVLLGLTVPAIQRAGEKKPMTQRFTDALGFYSSGFVVPIFAFFAAGVNIVDSGGLVEMLSDSVAIGIYLGLPLGKFLGITLSVTVMIKVFKLHLGQGVTLPDIAAVSLVTGIGFTVSLLIAQLSFAPGDPHGAHARVAVIVGSLISMALGSIAVRWRVRVRMKHASKTDIKRSDSPTDERLTDR